MPSILRAFTNRRVAVTLLEGFASALPLALTAGTLQAWLATEHVDIKTIGWFSLVGLPYTWKFLWAPLFDRYTTKFLGPRRGWLVLIQLMLFGGIALMGWVNPTTHLQLFALVAVCVAFMSASQDIVLDAYRTELLLPEERGPGAGALNIGLRAGLLLAGAGALIMSDRLPWHTVYLFLASTMAIGIIATLWGPEPTRAIIHPRSLHEAVIGPFIEFFRRKGAVAILLFVVFYKFGDAFAVSLATPFLMNVGFTKTEIGTVFKGIGMVATLIGGVTGGAIVSWMGINRSLWVFGILQALSNIGYLFLAKVGNNIGLLTGVIGFDQLCAGLGNAAFIAFMMALCNIRFTATQYALLTSVMSIARVTVGVPAGYVVAAFGWPLFFVVSILVSLPGLALLAVFAPWGKPDPTAPQDAATSA